MSFSEKTENTVKRTLLWSQIRRLAMVFTLGAAALQLVFFSLLVAGQAVPDKPIIENLAVSVANGTYGMSGAADRMGGSADTFTECVVAGTGLGSVDKNAFERAVVMPRIGSCHTGKDQILKLAAGEHIDPAQVGEYYRYWAGYTVITRPVLAVFGLSGLRIVAGGMLVASLVVAFSVVARRTSKWAATGLLLPLVISTNLMSTPSNSFSHAISVSVILFGVAISAWAAGKSMRHMVFGVGFSAALFCYMDLLTTPAISWAMCTAVVAGIAYMKSRDMKFVLQSGVLAAGVWIVAFAGTWVSRWAIAALFLGIRTTYKNVRETVDFRTTGEYQNVNKSLFAPTEANWNYWINQLPTATFVLILCLVAIVLALLITWRRHGLRTVALWPVLSLAAIVVIVWFEVLNNHSQIHAFFTYRGIPAALGILTFAALLLAVRSRLVTPVRGPQQDSLGTGQHPGEARVASDLVPSATNGEAS